MTRTPGIAITVNGARQEVPGPMTVDQLLDHLRTDRRMVAVERNGQLVRRGEFATPRVVDGDQIEIVSFVGGG